MVDSRITFHASFGFASKAEFNTFRVIRVFSVIRGSVFKLQKNDPRKTQKTRITRNILKLVSALVFN